MSNFDHDMLHCEGSNCKRRKYCLRFALYQDALANNLTHFSVHVGDLGTKCELYLPLEGQNDEK